MEYKYSYNITNFKYLSHLYNYIISNDINSILPTNFYLNIEITIDVLFNQVLSSEQLILLDNIILGYIPPQTLVFNVKTENIPLQQNNILPNNTFNVIGTYFYSIPDDNSFINSFKIIASVNGNTNYKLRIYDSINDKILCESNTLNNTTLQIITISDILNLPTNETLLEIQCIVSGNNKCTIKLIQIEYSKSI